ncbi:hypothetical protein DSECCO2_270050 [anaerobic digester metagenome]
MRVPRASTVAEPVSTVSHQTRANCTRALPTREKAWPPQMVKKFLFQEAAPSLLNIMNLISVDTGHQPRGQKWPPRYPHRSL